MNHHVPRLAIGAILWSLLALTTAHTAAGQAADSTLRLNDLLVEAAANNPSLRASYLNASAMTERRNEVSSLPDPTFMFAWMPYPIYTAKGTQRFQFRLEQMFPFPGLQGLQGDIADSAAVAAGFQARAVQLDIELQVKKAFFELYRIQQLDDLVHTFISTLEDFEEAASTQYRVGTGMQQAVLKAQLEKNSLSSMEIDLERNRRTTAEMLSRLLNRKSADALTGRLQAEAPPLPKLNPDSLLAIARTVRPEAKALSAEAGGADAKIELAKKRYWPDFGLNVTYFDIAPNDMLPMGTGTDALAIGASIKIPLQRGRRGSTVEEAKLRRLQVEAKEEALETQFRTEIADLVFQMGQEKEQITLYREVLIPQAEVTLQATLSDYTTGRTDFLNLLDAERMLFSLRTGYENIYARYLKATAALERAVGLSSFVAAREVD